MKYCSNINIIACRFISNTNTSNLGGALHAERSDVDLILNLFEDNHHPGSLGGAIHYLQSSGDFISNIFRNNSCASDGSALSIIGLSTATNIYHFSNNTFINNYSLSSGYGAIWFRYVPFVFYKNYIVSNNINCGGLYLDNSSGSLNQDVIQYNNPYGIKIIIASSFSLNNVSFLSNLPSNTN